MEFVTSVAYVAFALLFLGVILGLSPTLLLTYVLLLTKSQRPIWLSIFLIAGVATPILTLSLLSFWFIDPTAQIEVPKVRQIITIVPVIDIIIGTVLMFFGIRMLKELYASPSDKPYKAQSMVFTPKNVYFYGVVRTITRVSALGIMLVAGQLINKKSDGPYAAIGILWLACVALAPLVGLLILSQKDAKVLHRLQRLSDGLSGKTWQACIASALIFGGALLAIYGIIIM